MQNMHRMHLTRQSICLCIFVIISRVFVIPYIVSLYNSILLFRRSGNRLNLLLYLINAYGMERDNNVHTHE